MAGHPASGPLDLHEGIDTPRGEKAQADGAAISDPVEAGHGCARWPEHLRLLNTTTGELLRGRCKATNLCQYCQTLYVVETVEMLTLDAIEYAPTIWIVLTAREHLTRAQCRRHLRKLLEAARRRWPAIEWFVQVEFQRRGALHLNLLVKGVFEEELEIFYGVMTKRWCARVDAVAAPFDQMHQGGQWAGEISDGVGVVRYLAKMLAHGLKLEQRPPIGWKGHRTSQTRGYLVRPASVMRKEAQRALRLKRQIHRLGDATLAELALQVAEEHDWELWREPGIRLGVDLEARLLEDAHAPFRKIGAEPSPERTRDVR